MADIKNVNNMKEAHLGPSNARIKTDIIAYVRRTSRSLAPWEMVEKEENKVGKSNI